MEAIFLLPSIKLDRLIQFTDNQDMNDLRDLYQQVLIDHNQHPHNFCRIEDANFEKEGYNPLCGDQITLYVNEDNGIITDICFQGSGCAISTASASMMTDIVKNRTKEEILDIFNEFQHLVTTGEAKSKEKLGKLVILSGVAEYPMRIKCATLPWHTLRAILTGDKNKISTE